MIFQAPLPPLKPEQIRRSIYFYRSKAQCQEKLKQYEEKESLLIKKKKWLAKAVFDCNEAKKEYDTVINELRDPELRSQLSADKLASIKDVAKREWQDADR